MCAKYLKIMEVLHLEDIGITEDHPCEDNVIQQIKTRSWLEKSSWLDEYVLKIFGNPSSKYPLFMEVDIGHEEPEMYHEVCKQCDEDPCRCSTILQKNLWPENMWDEKSKYIKADQVFFATDSLLSDEQLAFVDCYVTNTGIRLSGRWGVDTLKYIAVSYVSSEDWFRDGISQQARNRLYHVAKCIGVDYIWIDELCLPPGDRTKQLETMGHLYRCAEAVCVISREVIMCENPYKLFSSIWMTRAWTLQEGYNAQKLVVLNSMNTNSYTIMTREHIPVEYRHIVLCSYHVSISFYIAAVLSRNIARSDDIPHVIASFMLDDSTKTSTTFYVVICFFVLFAMFGILYAIMGGTILYILLFVFAGCTGIVSVICLSMALYDIRRQHVLKWKNSHHMFESSITDSSVLLLSPNSNHGKRDSWKPDITKHDPIGIATCLSLICLNYEDQRIRRISDKIMSFSKSTKLEKIVYTITQIFPELTTFDRGGHDLNVDGKLLDKHESIQFVKNLNKLEWLWIKDAIVIAEKHDDFRVLLCINQEHTSMYWMSFGYVMLDENNILYRSHRFWILPVTYETSYKCRQNSGTYKIGGKFLKRF